MTVHNVRRTRGEITILYHWRLLSFQNNSVLYVRGNHLESEGPLNLLCFRTSPQVEGTRKRRLLALLHCVFLGGGFRETLTLFATVVSLLLFVK